MHSKNPFDSLEKRLAKEKRQRSVTFVRDAGNQVIESIGKALRATLLLPESRLSDTNRRAGRTALVAGILAAGSVIMLGQCTEPVECKTFDRSQFITEDLNVLATQISEKLSAYAYGDSSAFDGVQEQLLGEQQVQICGTADINAVQALTSKI